ncbi:MAG: hypothetical protein JNM24_02850 [Bdellovibrionaceae bacterium]|nr:hypothetical protein [Pseudobdellovibrionaceae bacterium]
MKSSKIIVVALLTSALQIQAQSYWGYGLQGGLSGCGYQVSQAEESSSYKDEIDELKKQLAEWKKEIAQLKRELSKEQTELRKHDSTLRGNFDSDAYTFIKSHFDSQHKCTDYKGQSDVAVVSENKLGSSAVSGEGAVIGRKPDSEPPRRDLPPSSDKKRKSMSDSDDDSNEVTAEDMTIEPTNLNKEWADVCDMQRDPKGILKSTICQKNYIMNGAKVNRAECQAAVLNYPRASKNIRNVKREIVVKQEAMKAAQAQIPELQKSMKEEQSEARKQRLEDIREGGVCTECLAQSQGQSNSTSFQSGQPNWGGVVGNSVMALLAYSSTKNFYSSMADSNANLGFPTQLPMTSPFMAATPNIIGAIGAGLGQGSFGCSGNSGGNSGMGGAMGPYAALGGSGQIGGAFGTPQWALGNQMGGGMYNQGMGNWGMNGPWGLSNTGLGVYPQQLLTGQLGIGNSLGSSLMNPYASLLGGNNYGLTGGSGLSGMLGLSGLNGLSGLTGLTGSLDSGMQQQILQLQMQQQQQLLQSQMRAYENAMQKQKAISGLQSELMGVIQRIQSIQYGTSTLGSSTSYLSGSTSLGSLGTSLGSLPSTATVPAPLATGR